MSKSKAFLASGGAAAVLIAALAFLNPTGGSSADDADTHLPASAVTSASLLPPPVEAASSTPVSHPGKPAANAAVAQTLRDLDGLPVKGKAPKTGYDRVKLFGRAWDDSAANVQFGHNGCDTRNDILKRDLKKIVFKPRTHDCVVMAGTLSPDPYTGKTINFKRGKDSAVIQIDHVVALASIWQTGGQQLTAAQRLSIANDPDNLIAADGPANNQKSDSDAASWLPANKRFRCQYVSMQVNVKKKYHLWVTKAEKDAITRVLSAC